MFFYTHVASKKDHILLRGYRDGQRVYESIPYNPYLFVPSKTSQSKYHTIFGDPVGRVDFDSMTEARNFYRQYSDVQGVTVYGMNNFVYPFIYDYFKGDIQYDVSQISICDIDIEVDIVNSGFPDVEAANNEVTLITLKRNDTIVVFGCQPYNNDDPRVEYYQCKNEYHLLESFINMWNSPRFSPDIISGWYIEFFDIPYLINRISKILGVKAARKLSPWGMINERRIQTAPGVEQQTWEIVGVSNLDYQQLYKKFAYTVQESYSLDHIASQELGERKLDYSEYGSLANLQQQNWDLYVKYCIKDTELIGKLDDKLKLIDLVLAMAYGAKSNYTDTFTTVRIWDVIIHNYLLDRNMVIPPKEQPGEDRGILGGYVKDPQVGMHEWVVSLDLNSLYPSIIQQYNISPETYQGWLLNQSECINKDHAENRALEILNGHLNKPEIKQELHNKNITCCANFTTFKRDQQGFLPALMSKYYQQRVIYKNSMIEAKKKLEVCEDEKEINQLRNDISKFNNLQMSIKILINSAYGALANKFYRWYRKEFAEAITASGQLTTRWIEQKLNLYLNKAFNTKDIDYVIACDTDSVYIKAEKFLISKEHLSTEDKVAYLDKICLQVLEPFIDKSYQQLFEYVNGFENTMKMKRECIANRGIWTAKKRYVLNVYNQEGVSYSKPKLKMMGIEAIRTSTPMVCRDAIKEALEIIMGKTELDVQMFAREFKTRFQGLPFGQVASPRSVSELDKYRDSSQVFKKGTPINAKGSLVYNHALETLKLTRKYEQIQPGQKIKYAYCMQPNPLNTSVIACPGELPPELNMDMYIDRNKQWDKSFGEPIKSILDKIGWALERRATLDAFFGD